MSLELREAAAFGDVAKVRMLLRRGDDPNASDEDGWTPLIFAVVGSHGSIIELLLRAGADPEIPTSSGTSAADFAPLFAPEVSFSRRRS